jgi:hypothetical protein
MPQGGVGPGLKSLSTLEDGSLGKPALRCCHGLAPDVVRMRTDDHGPGPRPLAPESLPTPRTAIFGTVRLLRLTEGPTPYRRSAHSPAASTMILCRTACLTCHAGDRRHRPRSGAVTPPPTRECLHTVQFGVHVPEGRRAGAEATGPSPGRRNAAPGQCSRIGSAAARTCPRRSGAGLAGAGLRPDRSDERLGIPAA